MRKMFAEMKSTWGAFVKLKHMNAFTVKL